MVLLPTDIVADVGGAAPPHPPTRESMFALPVTVKFPLTQIAHGGSIFLSRVTVVVSFLTAIGLVSFGTYPTAVTSFWLLWAPFVTVTLKPPMALTPTNVEPS